MTSNAEKDLRDPKDLEDLSIKMFRKWLGPIIKEVLEKPSLIKMYKGLKKGEKK